MSLIESRPSGDAVDDGAWNDVPMPGAWVAQGRCRTAPPNLFFPGQGEDVNTARAIYARCPVIEACREYGLAYPKLVGIFGALTASERVTVRREARSAPSPDIDQPARPRQSAPGELQRQLEQLLVHPGQWARVAHFAARGSAQTMASLLRTGRKEAPPGRWQFEGRRNDDGGSDLYALFEGAAEEEA